MRTLSGVRTNDNMNNFFLLLSSSHLVETDEPRRSMRVCDLTGKSLLLRNKEAIKRYRHGIPLFFKGFSLFKGDFSMLDFVDVKRIFSDTELTRTVVKHQTEYPPNTQERKTVYFLFPTQINNEENNSKHQPRNQAE